MKRRIIIGLGIAGVLIGGILIWGLTTTVGVKFPYTWPAACFKDVVDDTNGNGVLDPGEKFMDDVAGLQIQIDDPDGPYSGTYAFSDCHIDGTKADRTLTMHIIVPPGYTATTPTDIAVYAYAEPGFEDYPPAYRYIFLRHNSGG